MSNRFLSVLILIWVFWFWYLFYQFEIKPDKIKKQKEEEIELQKQQEINKIKEATLNRIEDKNIELTNKDNIENKIDLLKQKNHSFLNFEFDNLGTFYFRELEEKLWLYFDWRKLWEYDKIEKKYLDIKNIIWNNDYFYLKIWTNKYLYNLNTNSSQKLDLEVDIEYIKSWNIPQEFLFKTKVWTFLYLLSNNNFNYFNFFKILFIIMIDTYELLKKMMIEDLKIYL